MPDLILASSSPYRRELLTRLRLPFESASPDIDESHRPGESAEELVRRLSASKAEALAGRYPQDPPGRHAPRGRRRNPLSRHSHIRHSHIKKPGFSRASLYKEGKRSQRSTGPCQPIQSARRSATLAPNFLAKRSNGDSCTV